MKYLFIFISNLIKTIIYLFFHIIMFCLGIIWSFNISWSKYKIKHYKWRYSDKWHKNHHQEVIEMLESETFIQTLKRWFINLEFY